MANLTKEDIRSVIEIIKELRDQVSASSKFAGTGSVYR